MVSVLNWDFLAKYYDKWIELTFVGLSLRSFKKATPHILIDAFSYYLTIEYQIRIPISNSKGMSSDRLWMVHNRIQIFAKSPPSYSILRTVLKWCFLPFAFHMNFVLLFFFLLWWQFFLSIHRIRFILLKDNKTVVHFPSAYDSTHFVQCIYSNTWISNELHIENENNCDNAQLHCVDEPSIHQMHVRCVCMRVHMIAMHTGFVVWLFETMPIAEAKTIFKWIEWCTMVLMLLLLLLLLLPLIVPLLHDERSYWIQKTHTERNRRWINEWFFQHFSHLGYFHEYGRTFDVVVIFIFVNAIRYYVL